MDIQALARLTEKWFAGQPSELLGTNEPRAELGSPFHVHSQWDGGGSVSFGDKPGVFFYVSDLGGVLFIGRSDETTMLDATSRRFLGPKDCTPAVASFPSHAWVGKDIDPAVAKALALGQIHIVPVKVDPPEYTGYVYEQLLRFCEAIDGYRPLLNDKTKTA